MNAKQLSTLAATAALASLTLPTLAATATVPKAYKYYKLAVTKITGTSGLQIGELALYDKDGNRVNLNLTNKDNVRNNDWVTRLSEPNTCTLLENGCSGTSTTHNDATQKLFDGNLGTKAYVGSCSKIDESNSSTWPTFIMRLADDAPAVVSYNLSTANDNVWAEGTKDGRTVTGWVLSGSSDGSIWFELDRQPSRAPSVPTPITDKTWYNGGTPLPVTDNSGAQYFVAAGETLALDRTLRYESIVNGGTVTVADGVTAWWDVASGDRVTLPGGALAGTGAIEKRGAGELRVGGDNSAFAGTVAAKGGTLRFVPTLAPQAFKYYRLNLKGKNGGNTTDAFELGEIALYDDTGARINLNLTNKGNSKGVGDLTASSFTFVENGAWASAAGANEAPEKMFDGNTGTKMYSGGFKPSADKWPYVLMRLADGAKPVVAYNMATGNDTWGNPNRLLVSWSLEGSMDGKNWLTLDAVTDDPRWNKENGKWFNKGRAYPVAIAGANKKSAKYYRLSIIGLQKCGGYEGLQMDEIALYDVYGNRLNLNATYQGDGLAATALNADSFTCIMNGHSKGGSAEWPDKLTDGNTSTKAYFNNGTFDESHDIKFVMRLKDGAPAVAGYNICSGTDDNWAWGANRCRTAGSWKLECSDDGATWTLLAKELDSAAATHANNTWFNGGVPMTFAGYETATDVVPENAALSVASGATLELPTAPYAGAKKLTLDCLDAGTIRNFKAADGMALELTNFKAFKQGHDILKDAALPLTFAGAVDVANLATWQVTYDGKTYDGYKVTYADGKLYVSGGPGLFIFVR